MIITLTEENMRTFWANISSYIVDIFFIESRGSSKGVRGKKKKNTREKKKKSSNKEDQAKRFNNKSYRIQLSYQAISLVAVQVMCKHVSCRQLDQTNRISSASNWTGLY